MLIGEKETKLDLSILFTCNERYLKKIYIETALKRQNVGKEALEKKDA